MKLDHSLTPDTKINSKWMKDLNMRQESIKILEENTGNTLVELGHSSFLQDTSMNGNKSKMNYWDLIKIGPGPFLQDRGVKRERKGEGERDEVAMMQDVWRR